MDHSEIQLPYVHVIKFPPPQRIKGLYFFTFSLQCHDCLIKFEIEHRGLVSGTSASYSEGPAFKTGPEDLLETFVFSLILLDECRS